MKRHIPIGDVEVIAFSGPDAVSFLNGQLTQDARLAGDGSRAVFSCVTDAKGRLQFRVVVTADGDGTLLVAVPAGHGEVLEARLTRYLIADDAEAALLPGVWRIVHFIGGNPEPPDGGLARGISRFDEEGCDWWLRPGVEFAPPDGFDMLAGDELEHFRILRGVPAVGTEITAGMLPPEARLETTDISYSKGCYIGQEVISRIRSAGKVNRLLTRFAVAGDDAVGPGPLATAEGRPAGEITSVSPLADADGRVPALGFLKRGISGIDLKLGANDVREMR